MTQIQEAISRLPANEKSALATWLQSQEEPVLYSVARPARQGRRSSESGKGVPLERACEKIRGWAVK